MRTRFGQGQQVQNCEFRTIIQPEPKTSAVTHDWTRTFTANDLAVGGQRGQDLGKLPYRGTAILGIKADRRRGFALLLDFCGELEGISCHRGEGRVGLLVLGDKDGPKPRAWRRLRASSLQYDTISSSKYVDMLLKGGTGPVRVLDVGAIAFVCSRAGCSRWAGVVRGREA